MKITLIAIGKKMPQWVSDGFYEYANRLPANFSLNLVELPAIKRAKNMNIKEIIEKESTRLLQAIPKEDFVIALDEHGENWTTKQLAQHLQTWQENERHISFMVGGPDGLSEKCLQKAEKHWALSKLTFPHMLVRVMIAEQIYRAWSILKNLPYHRA